MYTYILETLIKENVHEENCRMDDLSVYLLRYYEIPVGLWYSCLVNLLFVSSFHFTNRCIKIVIVLRKLYLYMELTVNYSIPIIKKKKKKKKREK